MASFSAARDKDPRLFATTLVLLAAVLHAAWNTLVKFSAERLLVVASMDAIAFFVALLLLPFVSVPPAYLWPWLIGSALFELLYRYLLIQAYRTADLGMVYPLMRGLSPLVVLGLTLAMGSEPLGAHQLLGILLIPCGMACLLWQGGGGERLPWAVLPVVLMIGVCIGSYTWIDGQALQRWARPLDYLAWLTLISAWPFPTLAMLNRRRSFVNFWQTQWRLGTAVGICVLASYALVLWAMAAGSVAEAAALRETSVILVVLFGMRYLKEPFGLPRLLACALVVAGIMIMKIH